MDTHNSTIVGSLKLRGLNWLKRNGYTLAIILLILGLWEFYSRFINARGDIYFPSIDYAISQSIAEQSQLIEGIQITFTEVMGGFFVAVVVGIVLGVIFSEFFTIRQSAFPLLIFGYSIPNAILAPLFVVWFGTGLEAVILYVAWVGFFPVMISTITGMSQVEEEFQHLGEITGATRWQMIRKIRFWAALPHIKTGVKVGVQQSVVGAIVAEFIATGGGLGYIILSAHRLLQEGLMVGALFIVMFFAAVMYKGVDYTVEYISPP